jgi:hypothetical protein
MIIQNYLKVGSLVLIGLTSTWLELMSGLKNVHGSCFHSSHTCLDYKHQDLNVHDRLGLCLFDSHRLMMQLSLRMIHVLMMNCSYQLCSSHRCSKQLIACMLLAFLHHCCSQYFEIYCFD